MIHNMIDYLQKKVLNQRDMILQYQETVRMDKLTIDKLVQENALLKQKYGVK